MIRIFQERDKEKLLERLESRKNLVSGDIAASARQIVAQVREQGDKALLKFTEQFDKVKLSVASVRLASAPSAATARPFATAHTRRIPLVDKSAIRRSLPRKPVSRRWPISAHATWRPVAKARRWYRRSIAGFSASPESIAPS